MRREGFHDRARELAVLEERWASSNAELIVLYGRRRVGKTRILRQFLKEKAHVYLLGDLRSEHDQLAEVTRALHAFSGEPLLADQPLSSWSAALEMIFRLAEGGRLAVAIDEFQYFCQATPALPSLVQRLWDGHSRGSSIFLVLCGSYVSFMESEVLGHRSPLYGRRTGQIHLKPVDYLDAAGFLESYGPADRILAYAIVGGMPAYLQRLDASQSVLHNVRRAILDPMAVLFSEARFLLMEELREPRNYFSLLRAIATGRTTLGEIADEAGLPPATAAKYLGVLRGMGLVERRVPVTERHPERSRRGIYRITDNYLTFWFRYVLPGMGLIEFGQTDLLMQMIEADLPAYVGPRFEEICRQFLLRFQGSTRVPVVFQRLGGWWSAGEEIDLVGVQGREITLAAECKWTNEWVKPAHLDQLKARALRAGAGPQTRYALFSKSGFDPNLVSRAEGEGILLYGLEDLWAGQHSRGQH